MPWNTKEIHKMRKEFIEYLLENSVSMAEACRLFGISRRTGYKWKKRYTEFGIDGLVSRSKRPKSSIIISETMIYEIVKIRNKHSSWGARKIQQRLKNLELFTDPLPSYSSINRVLKRCGLIKPKRRYRSDIQNTRISDNLEIIEPNDEWSIDYKGWWMSKDGTKRCQPLTIRDSASKYLLCACLTTSSTSESVQEVMIELFKKYGLPKSIRSDNGPPFASSVGLLGLTKLSVWWISLGIKLVRTRPGCPQDNGAHERMHADMKRELQNTLVDTQSEIDKWVEVFNTERPHEALDGDTPFMHYKKSIRKYMPNRQVYQYENMKKRKLCTAGKLSLDGYSYFIGSSFVKKQVGIKDLGDNIQELNYCGYVLGHINSVTHEFTPVQKVDKGCELKTIKGVYR